MENISEQTLIEQATSPSRLLELNRMFQVLYANRLRELMMEQQSNQHQAQDVSSAAIVTPPPSPPSSDTEKQMSIALSYYTEQSSTAEQSLSPERHRSAPAKRSVARKIRFDPYQMKRRPSHLSAVSINDPLEVDLRYHESMARRVVRPTAESTPEELVKRDQMAYAARVSRAKERALQKLLKTEHDDVAKQNRSRKLFVAQKRVYLTTLCDLLGLSGRDLAEQWESVREVYEREAGDESKA